MSLSYEELRTAALDILSGREKSSYGFDQYGHLKIGIGEVIQKRKGLGPVLPSHYPADTALDYPDAETFREVFWDLFRQGVITLGKDDANAEYPFFRLTAWGRRIAAGENGYFVHDVSAYEARLRREVEGINELTVLYLKEALQSFRSDCIVAATVMLGVATEHTFLLLLEKAETNPAHQARFAPLAKIRSVGAKLEKFREILRRDAKDFPKELTDNLDIQFAGIQAIIRHYRNDSGHPSGNIIPREEAYVLLSLFPHYCKKAYQLMKHLEVVP